MRLTAIFFFTLLVVFSVSAMDSNNNSTDVNAANSTDTSNSNHSTAPTTAVAQSCSDCWVKQRSQMDACMSIPSSELSVFQNISDSDLGSSSNCPSVVSCLCALSANVNKLISACPSCESLGQALTQEASYVNAHVCGSKTAGTINAQSGSGSTSDSNSTPTTTGSTGDESTDPSVNAAQANSAISIVPWTKSIISLAVAFVAAGVYVF